MAASDTFVGIVGSIVLVSVMVGVFVYEYNNAPEVEDPDPVVDPTLSESDSCDLQVASSAPCEALFAPDAGGVGIAFTVEHSPVNSQLIGPLVQYTVSVLDPEGSLVVQETVEGDWNHAISPVMEGHYTLRISLPAGSTGGNFQLTADYTY